MLTPASLHYGQAAEIRSAREKTLELAWQRHPERFVHGVPQPERLPKAVWINTPGGQAKKKNEAPAVHCAEAPEATSLTHPRSGYPSDVAFPQSHLPFNRTRRLYRKHHH